VTPDEPSLEGWEPEVGDGLTLARVIDLAFDYRGDVTVVRTDGSELVGYLFNRDAEAPQPFVQLFERAGGDRPWTVPYGAIRTIRFTGKDTAAGNSYAAWRERRDAARTGSAPDA
jgi:hypothetical protein